MNNGSGDRSRVNGLFGCALLLGAALPAAAQEVELDFYGHVMLDMIYDFDRVAPDGNDTLRVSQIPVNCPGDAGCGSDGELIFGIRQTRYGLDATVPTDIGDIKTKLEFELFGVGTDAGKITPRLRHAWATINEFGFGQTNSVFMDGDVFPNSIDYWGPSGMMFFRNIQARWTPVSTDTQRIAIALESPSAGIDSGKVPDVSPNLNVRSKEELPDLTAHWRIQQSWGHFQAAVILRQVAFEAADDVSGESFSGEEVGYGVNLSGTLNTVGRDRVLWQLALGEGIGNYLNDGGIDLAPKENLRATTVPVVSWLLFYDRWWSEAWSSSIGWSRAELDNTDGQRNAASETLDYGLVNLLHHPADNITVGAELLHGALGLNDGAEGTDTRVQVSFKFNF
ncbi:MAG TPA: DcaP family trimeric outer membrane transporter [Pseudohaliea sp.]|nr:DcaP family trimeric outer membrane transporter [Pseudohaliea sp.]